MIIMGQQLTHCGDDNKKQSGSRALNHESLALPNDLNATTIHEFPQRGPRVHVVRNLPLFAVILEHVVHCPNLNPCQLSEGNDGLPNESVDIVAGVLGVIRARFMTFVIEMKLGPGLVGPIAPIKGPVAIILSRVDPFLSLSTLQFFLFDPQHTHHDLHLQQVGQFCVDDSV